MRAIGIIPARWASSRFPGKPLAPLAGVAMIERTWRGARAARSLEALLVATDDERIARACRAFGADVVMTNARHETGTDRLGEVARGLDADVVVNVQGDEPLVEGRVVDAAVDALAADAGAALATVAHALEVGAVDDPNRVKVWVDARGRAVRFARECAARPDPRAPRLRDDPGDPRVLQHVGLYAYRRDFLLEFVAWPPSDGERAHRLEQLRALERGCAIAVAEIDGWTSAPVDVPGDVARVEAVLAARARGAGRAPHDAEEDRTT